MFIYGKKCLKMGIMVIGQKRSMYEQCGCIECVKRIKVDSTDLSSIETGTLTLGNKTNKTILINHHLIFILYKLLS